MITALTQMNRETNNSEGTGQEEEEAEEAEEGCNRIGRRRRGDALCCVSSGADVSELESPVIRSMGMEKGLVEFFFSSRLLGKEEETRRNTPSASSSSSSYSSRPSTPTQTKVKPMSW